MKRKADSGTMTPQEKYLRMTTRPVGRLVTELAGPSIVSMLISGIYNLADTFFIGRINTPSVAALGIVFSYMVLIQSVAIFFGQGRATISPGRSAAGRWATPRRWRPSA